MSRFRKLRREVPGLNTASLPDLIFTVLFFFMIVTHVRNSAVKVDYNPPKGSQIEKLANRSGATYIYIGRPAGLRGAGGDSAVCVQVNDRIVDMADIPKFIAAERSRMSAEKAQDMTVNLRADSASPMGIIEVVKRALRSAGALRVVYSAENAAK